MMYGSPSTPTSRWSRSSSVNSGGRGSSVDDMSQAMDRVSEFLGAPTKIRRLVMLLPVETREEADDFEIALTEAEQAHGPRSIRLARDQLGRTLLWHACDLLDEHGIHALIKHGATRDLSWDEPPKEVNPLHLLRSRKSPLLEILRVYIDDDDEPDDEDLQEAIGGDSANNFSFFFCTYDDDEEEAAPRPIHHRTGSSSSVYCCNWEETSMRGLCVNSPTKDIQHLPPGPVIQPRLSSSTTKKAAHSRRDEAEEQRQLVRKAELAHAEKAREVLEFWKQMNQLKLQKPATPEERQALEAQREALKAKIKRGRQELDASRRALSVGGDDHSRSSPRSSNDDRVFDSIDRNNNL